MDLELKPDFEATRQRWDQFWAGRKLDRPMLQILLRKPDATAVAHLYPVRPDRDPVPQAEQALAYASQFEYLGEAMPSFMMEFGAEHFATFLGAPMHYHPDGHGAGWVVPFVQDWDDVDLTFQPSSHYWQRTVEFIRVFRARCDGRLLINAPVLSPGLDALAAIRGPEQLLVDLLDCPDKVQGALEQVRAVYRQVVQALAQECGWDHWGSCNWLGMYHCRYISTIQSDFSCMISNGMFRQFELPNLVHQTSFYDAVCYHLDGPQAVHHLKTICGIADIDVIQYVPVPSESPEHIESVYREAMALGKGIIRGADARMIHRLWHESPNRQMVFAVWMSSRAEAQELLESFAR